jgi:DNA sulfur modification protein DndD
MLRFVKLVIDNFGPFKGTQTIDFTRNDGVTIIWGNNGRGKTTLLNIFRYALFGKIQTRQGKVDDLSSLSNIEGRSEGKYGFKVVLHMEMDEDRYELTRQFDVRDGVSVPTKNDDFVQNVFLRKNTSVLSGEARDHFLRNIMPEQVARFFLFDGELLQEYEELLKDETHAGALIKEAIEKILGVPVLTQGAVDIKAALDEYRSEKNKAAQKSTDIDKINGQIAQLQSKLQHHTDEFDRLKKELFTALSEKDSTETEMSQTEHIRALLLQAQNLEGSIEEKKAQKEALIASICVETKDAWKTMVIPCLGDALKTAESRMYELESKGRAHEQAAHFIDEMKTALDEHHCPVCDQDLGEDLIGKLQQRVLSATSEFSGLSDSEVQEQDSLRLRIATLRQMQFENNKSILESYEKRLQELIVQISKAERDLKTVRDEISKYGDIDESITHLVDQHSKIVQRIKILEDGKKQEQDIIEETRQALSTLESKIDSLAVGAKFEAAKKRVELLEQLYGIFDRGVAEYRDKLRKDVERDATELFLKIRNDEDYIRLEINENYGLTIIHRSLTPVPLRSSGYEHVVALSLIGALHQNAPLSGPIIMDSPFGRLDPGHKTKIASALPSMSNEVILLAYTSEIDEQEARERLGSALNHEYRLTRHSSFNTQIERQN